MHLSEAIQHVDWISSISHVLISSPDWRNYLFRRIFINEFDGAYQINDDIFLAETKFPQSLAFLGIGLSHRETKRR